jgi:hypothetical protein
MSRELLLGTGAHGGAGGIAALPNGEGLWRADLGITIDTGVSAWVNQIAGNTWGDFSQGTGTLQPALRSGHWASGKDAVQGDDVDDRLLLPAFRTLTPPLTMAFVLQSDDIADTSDFFGGDGSSNAIRVLSNGIFQLRINAANLNLTNTSAIAANTKYIVEVYATGAGVYTIYIANSDVTSGTPTDTDPIDIESMFAGPAGAAPTDFHIGYAYFASADHEASRASVIVPELQAFSGL